VDDEKQKDLLYQSGLKYYKEQKYFEAHEMWEDLWSDFYLEDRKFIQGLIQLSVSFVHIGNGNINGAKSLLNKSRDKFCMFSGIHRNISLARLLSQIKLVKVEYDNLENLSEFNWDIIPDLK
tara:strand:- start:3058 stop:3423 length:366 start_codon:yes stop_codon:yes gene_type:complete